jgi:tetratricopeptide (TPR) repeat protein
MPRIVVALILMIFIGIISGYGAQNDISIKEELKNIPAQQKDKPRSTGWRYKTESEWLVGAVATDIAEMIAYSCNRPNPDVEVRTTGFNKYTVVVNSWDTKEVVLKVEFTDKYVWSPDTYKPLTIALLGSQAGIMKSKTPDNAIIATLLKATPEVIVQEDLRISEALGKDFLSPDNHEQAALVISALALRENAKSFTDLRHLLCRLCAHLTISRALRSKDSAGSPPGLWAESVLLTLAGRATEASAISEKVQSGPADVNWKKALTLRSTGDWRILGKAENASYLELREWLRASIERRGHLTTLEMLDNIKFPMNADFSRSLISKSYPVEIANSVAVNAFKIELSEIMQVYKAYTGSEFASKQGISELNETGSRCIRAVAGKQTVAVLGWSNWAPFLRRHLLFALHENLYALKNMLDLGEEARETERQQGEKFAGLQDYGFVQILSFQREPDEKRKAGLALTTEANAACTRAWDSIGNNPEFVPLRLWESAYKFCNPGLRKGIVQNPERWFQPVLLAGTTYDLEQVIASDAGSKILIAELEKMYRLAPGNYTLAKVIEGSWQDPRRTPEKVEKFLKPFLDYDRRAVYEILSIADNSSKDASPYYERICNWDPDGCVDAGLYFAVQGDNERAIKAFERALEKSQDPLILASDADWPVDYYLDNGRRDDAFRFAKFAADVYSYSGLSTMGRFMERLGLYNDAVSWYRKITVRYEDDTEENLFYIRYRLRIGGDRFAKESEIAFNKIFPKGLEKKLTLGDPRKWGYRLTNKDITPMIKKAGLSSGDLILTADGYQLSSREQWKAIQNLNDASSMSLHLIKGQHYMQTTISNIKKKYGPPAKQTLTLP